jgi:CheY-like chemotaxis protein
MSWSSWRFYVFHPVRLSRVLSFQPFQAKSLTQQRNVPFNLPGGLFHIGGVEDYILKPVNADQLHAALSRLRQRLDEERKRAASSSR